jgi:hypothetical protein
MAVRDSVRRPEPAKRRAIRVDRHLRGDERIGGCISTCKCWPGGCPSISLIGDIETGGCRILTVSGHPAKQVDF